VVIMAVPIQQQGIRSCVHGVVDSLYPSQLAQTQIPKAVNFNMSVDGQLESRGGSIRVLDSQLNGTLNSTFDSIFDFVAREVDGTLKHRWMVKVDTRCLPYDPSTGVYGTGVVTVDGKASMINTVDSTGAEVLLYADGTNFLKFDGTTWTSILSEYQAGVGVGCPKYLWSMHDRVFAAGDPNIPDIVVISDPLSPDTNWGSNSWIRIAGGIGAVTGLNQIYNMLFVTTDESCHLITGTTLSDFAPVPISDNVGCSSHWSITTLGARVFFANLTGIVVGTLRAAEADGLNTEYISDNMSRVYDTITDSAHGEIESCYSSVTKQLYFSLRTGAEAYPDKLLVLSVARSQFNTPRDTRVSWDTRFVWAGWQSGMEYGAIATVNKDDGSEHMIVGGNVYMYFYHNGYKDFRVVGATTGTDIAYEINTQEIDFGRKRKVRKFYPVLYQAHNSAWSYQILVNRREILPVSAKDITFLGNIPYWNDGGATNPAQTTVWGESIWDDKPMLLAELGVGHECNTIMYLLTCDGSNAQDELTFVSYSQDIQ
jgi:hypothetical protein